MPSIRLTTRPKNVDAARAAADAAPAKGAAVPAEARGGKGIAGMALPQLPVSRIDGALNQDGSTALLHPKSRPTATLSLDEIRDADPGRRPILETRYAAYTGFLAARRVGGTAVATLPSCKVAAGGASVQSGKGKVSLDDGRGGRATIEVVGHTARLADAGGAPISWQDARRIAAQALGACAHDDSAAQLAAFLLGGDGLLMREGAAPLRDADRLQQPKLLCWDFNGTVERTEGVLRSGMVPSAAALNRMGAVSVLTTSVAPEKCELFLDGQDLPFNAFFGGPDVRPHKGQKEYTGVCQAYGVAPEEARHHLVTIGDSRTDGSGDLPGVLHIECDAATPAPAIEELLLHLEAAGKGSIAFGVEALMGRPLQAGDDARFALGNVELTIEGRMVGHPVLHQLGQSPAPQLVPVVKDVAIRLDARAVAAGLAAPDGDATVERARRMSFEHLADSMDEAHVPATLTALPPGRATEHGVRAVFTRLAVHAVEIEDARAIARGANELFLLPKTFDDVLSLLVPAVSAGDADALSTLRDAVTTFPQANQQARRATLQGLDDYAAEVAQIAADGKKRAAPFWAGAKLDDSAKQAQGALVKLAKARVPFDAKGQEKMLVVIAAIAKAPPPGADALFDALARSVAERANETKEAVVEAFTERAARTPELTELLAWGEQQVALRTASFAAIDATLRKMGYAP